MQIRPQTSLHYSGVLISRISKSRNEIRFISLLFSSIHSTDCRRATTFSSLRMSGPPDSSLFASNNNNNSTKNSKVDIQLSSSPGDAIVVQNSNPLPRRIVFLKARKPDLHTETLQSKYQPPNGNVNQRQQLTKGERRYLR